MALIIKCDLCKTELTEPGALLFSPPEIDSIPMKTVKYHICTECYDFILMDAF